MKKKTPPISPGKYCHIPNCGRKPLKTSCFCGAHEAAGKKNGRGTKLPALVLVAALCASCTVTEPVAATGPLDGGKRGTATVVKVCGFVLSGDGSTATAAKNGTVRYVQTVDVRHTNLLGIYKRSVTVVTGE